MSNWYGSNSNEGTTRRVKEIDSKISSLQKERRRILERTKESAIDKLRREFLDSEWVLRKDMTLYTKNAPLARKLADLEESGEWDYDSSLSKLFGDDCPFTHLTGCEILLQNDDGTLTGEIICYIENDFSGDVIDHLQILGVVSKLENVLPYFKNLKIEYGNIVNVVENIRNALNAVLDILWKCSDISSRLPRKGDK